MTTLVLPDGYSPLPADKLVTIVTYLRIDAQSARAPAGPPPAGVALERLRGADVARYRALFAAVGMPWLWFSRLTMAPEALAALIDEPAIEAYAVTERRADGVADIGLLEVDLRSPIEAELAFCGLVPEAVGRGLGRWMIARGIELGFSRGAPRVMVHTCTLDHPAAIRAYERAGFRAYKRAIEIENDPRLDGRMPRDVAPHFPVIETD